MDCQFIMGFFAYMYYHSFIALNNVTLGDVIETAIQLTAEEQMELVKGISKHLHNQGVISDTVCWCDVCPGVGANIWLGTELLQRRHS